MSWELLRRIAQDFKPEPPEYLSLFFNGEPLMDSRIVEIMQFFQSEWHSTKIGISTNASLLTDDIAVELLNIRNLKEVRISVNASSPQEYMDVVGLDWSATEANIDNFLKRRKELARLDMLVVFSFINCKNPGLVEKWGERVLYDGDMFLKPQVQDRPIILANGKVISNCLDFDAVISVDYTGWIIDKTVQSLITSEGYLLSMGTEQLQNRITILKAREFELQKEREVVHDELLLAIGRKQGSDEAMADVDVRIKEAVQKALATGDKSDPKAKTT